MKRSPFFILCICLFMLSFSGCYRYPRPEPNPDHIWVSDDPEISFVYFDAGEPCKGNMNIDGNIIEIEIYFDYGNQMFIHPVDEELRNDSSDGRLLLGCIEVSEDQIIYSIFWRKDNIWEGIDTITFHKEVNDASQSIDETEELQLLNKSICALGGPDGLAVFDLQDRKALALSG